MKRHTIQLGAVLMAVLLLMPGCGASFQGRTAKDTALQALVTTTRSAVLMMTAAGIAYDAGAFGAPGSAKAEGTWDKIATESRRLSGALNSWQAAVVAGQDASAFVDIATQALAVIGALLPKGSRADLMRDVPSVASLECPDSFRKYQFAGGAR